MLIPQSDPKKLKYKWFSYLKPGFSSIWTLEANISLKTILK